MKLSKDFTFLSLLSFLLLLYTFMGVAVGLEPDGGISWLLAVVIAMILSAAATLFVLTRGYDNSKFNIHDFFGFIVLSASAMVVWHILLSPLFLSNNFINHSIGTSISEAGFFFMMWLAGFLILLSKGYHWLETILYVWTVLVCAHVVGYIVVYLPVNLIASSLTMFQDIGALALIISVVLPLFFAPLVGVPFTVFYLRRHKRH